MWVFIIVHQWLILYISNPKQGVAIFQIVWQFYGYKFKIATRIVFQIFLGYF